eukprot:TRINITY_DN1368_c0_g1_i1.p1 TRINITY_DN1368_c0_g1~~TRINITY_DN1368_c0_g1_i1.p1  ORF type:complete len:328 (+),score=73.46 TRINITY_DN1368_c0_g1_i1:60-1043(+)
MENVDLDNLNEFEHHIYYPFKYSEEIGWIKETEIYNNEENTNNNLEKLTLLTWNIWFDKRTFAQRYPSIMKEIKTHNPHFFCLQEVIPKFLKVFLSDPYIKEHYSIIGNSDELSSDHSSLLGSYGVIIFSRIRVKRFVQFPLPSIYGRELLLAETYINDKRVIVSTVHLESKKPMSRNRKLQLEKIFYIFNQLYCDDNSNNDSTLFLMGDFNFHDKWPAEQANIDDSFIDVWSNLYPNEDGFTEDTYINIMRYNQKKEHKQVRFDRMLIRSLKDENNKNIWTPNDIKIIGTESINEIDGNNNDNNNEEILFPSDHFGLVATFNVNQN